VFASSEFVNILPRTCFGKIIKRVWTGVAVGDSTIEGEASIEEVKEAGQG
jgi:hypothetical protein